MVDTVGRTRRIKCELQQREHYAYVQSPGYSSWAGEDWRRYTRRHSRGIQGQIVL